MSVQLTNLISALYSTLRVHLSPTLETCIFNKVTSVRVELQLRASAFRFLAHVPVFLMQCNLLELLLQ